MNQIFKNNRQILVALVLAALVFSMSSCEKYSYLPPVINTLDTLRFSTDIQPIFNANCTTCHGVLRAPDLREGKSFQALTTGGFVDLPGETSKLYLKITSADHTARTTDADKQKVLIWINQGAMDN